jgi:NNP family nitrate/nitrite transporter-like MFS transporter
MPLLFAMLVGTFAMSAATGWRLSMVIAGAVCALAGVAYFFLTQDTPDGNFREIKAKLGTEIKRDKSGSFLAACKDHRVWMLFLIYGACFGIELTINNIAAIYFVDNFTEFQTMSQLDALKWAGIIASLFGLMNIFARTLGGVFGDRFGEKWGLNGRVKWLYIAVFCEGLALMAFSQMSTLAVAIPVMIVFSLFVQMSEGATFSVVPFINKKAIGSVSGIVGAGGNAGAVAAGFLFKSELSWSSALFVLGVVVIAVSFTSFLVRFDEATEKAEREAHSNALNARKTELAGAVAN